MNVDLAKRLTPCIYPEAALQRDIDFSKLSTPGTHGDTLVQPLAKYLGRLVAYNRDLIAGYDFSVMGRPIGELRKETRREVAASVDEPVVVTGHQPEFIHAGVWAKHVIAQRLALAVGGRALNLVVDNDVPKHTEINLPHPGCDGVSIGSVRYADWRANAAFESMPVAGVDECRRFSNGVREVLGEYYSKSLWPVYIEAYERGATSADWVEQAVAARKHLEQSLGVQIDDRRVSQVWGGPLVGMLIADAGRFAEAYNQSLAEYRRRYDVRGSRMPVPDLECDSNRCEIPLWVYVPGGPRLRLFVENGPSTIRLFAEGESIGEIPRECLTDWEQMGGELEAISPWSIRPRALTLTLWARLFLADLFIHGIGGAKYDRVTDEIIRTYFGVEPPAMACVSATVHPDLVVPSAAEPGIDTIMRHLRDLEYNPQCFAPNSEAAARKVEAINRARWLRENDRSNHQARRHAFNEIRRINREIAAQVPELGAELRGKLTRIRRVQATESAVRNREYFLATCTRSGLEMLLDRLANVQELSGACIV